MRQKMVVAEMAGQIVKRGERSFLVRVFLGRDSSGKRKYHNETIKGSKKDAERALTALLRKRDMGSMMIEPTRLNLQEYLEYWLEAAARPRLSKHTHKEYGAMLKRYIVPTLGVRKLTKLSALDIQGVYSEMLSRGLSARMVRYTHAVLSSALKQAVKWSMLGESPAQYVDLPKQHKKEMTALTEDETQQFLEAARLDPHYVLFVLLLGTGLRPGESLALKWTDLDTASHRLTVQRAWARSSSGYTFKSPKNRKSNRGIDLPDSLTKLLLNHRLTLLEGSELIFPSTAGTPINERNLTLRHFKPLLRAAGLSEKVRLYDLRHTHATLLLKAGIHPKIVSERLGHSSITLTMDTYSHVLPGMQRESAERLEQMLFKPKK
jgi:integrase